MNEKLCGVWLTRVNGLMSPTGADLDDWHEVRDWTDTDVVLAHASWMGTPPVEQPGEQDRVGIIFQLERARAHGRKVLMVCGPGGIEGNEFTQVEWWFFCRPFLREYADIIALVEPLHEHGWDLNTTRERYRRFVEITDVAPDKLMVTWACPQVPDPAFAEFVLGFEAYEELPQGHPDAGARVRARTEAVLESLPPSARVVVIPQCFDRNGEWKAGDAALDGASWAALEPALDDPRVIGWMPFAWARATGQSMQNTPELRHSTMDYWLRSHEISTPPGEGEMSQQEREQYEALIASLKLQIAEVREDVDDLAADMEELLPETPVKPRLRRRWRRLVQRLARIAL